MTCFCGRKVCRCAEAHAAAAEHGFTLEVRPYGVQLCDGSSVVGYLCRAWHYLDGRGLAWCWEGELSGRGIARTPAEAVREIVAALEARLSQR